MNKKNFLFLLFLTSSLNAGFFDFLSQKIKEKAEKETLTKQEQKFIEKTNNNDSKDKIIKEKKIKKSKNKEKTIKNINHKNNKNSTIDKTAKINKIEIDNKSKIDNKAKKTQNSIEVKTKLNQKKIVTVKEKLKTLLKINKTNIKNENIKTTNSFQSNLEKDIKNINSNNSNSYNIDTLQKKLLDYKYEIDKNIQKYNFKKVYYLLDKILANNQISKKLKMKFVNYAFWKILILYSNINEISKKEILNCKKVISHIINKMDVNYNLDTKIDKYIFDILQEKISAGSYFISFLNEYFPYGINDNILYSKLFKLFSSDLMAKNLYLKKVAIYLKEDFNRYFNSADDIILSEDLLDLYLQMLLKAELFTGNTTLNIIKKYKYINPLNSNVYYYLAMFSKINEYKMEDYENLLKTSIKYNVYNVKSWKALIQYYTEKRSEKFKKLKKKEKKKILKFDKYILKLIDYIIKNIEINNKYYSYFLMKKAKLLYLEGTTFQNPNKLYESLIIYNQFKKCLIVNQIKHYIKIISKDFYEEKKIDNIHCK